MLYSMLESVDNEDNISGIKYVWWLWNNIEFV